MVERYDRQKLINGWNQEAFENSRVLLVGSDILSDLILVDLLSLGIGNIIRIGCSGFFEFEKINPCVYLEQREEEITSLQMAEFCVGDADYVIDATNNAKTKFFSNAAAKNRGKKYFSASCDESGFLFSSTYSMVEGNQRIANSIVCSALLTDELRKRINQLKDDLLLDEFSYALKEPSQLEKKVLLVGAGAIGTFSALALALSGADLTIVDFDSIEETNLNRQFLFYDSIGRNKAETLRERLEKYSKKVRAINQKIGEDFDPQGYDFVFCCVDNNPTRYYMNRATKRYNIPLINGGSSVFAGNSMPYVPGKTACLDCQSGFDLTKSVQEAMEKRKSGECFHPSLIFSNQIVAGLMFGCLSNTLEGKFEKINYSSGSGIFDQGVYDKCFEECKT